MTRIKVFCLAPWGPSLVLALGCFLVAGCGGPKNPIGAEVQTSKTPRSLPCTSSTRVSIAVNRPRMRPNSRRT